MTFDDDFLRIQFETGPKNVTCKSIGVSWPPPEILEFQGFKYKRLRMSEISDEIREKMTRVMRGAEYVHHKEGL